MGIEGEHTRLEAGDEADTVESNLPAERLFCVSHTEI
jgi:hypothetical protein